MRSRLGLAWTAALHLLAMPIVGHAGGQIESADGSIELGSPVTEHALTSIRGKQGLSAPLSVQYTQATLNASISGNTLSASPAGDNLAGNAVFSGASGIATMIQNSGSQVVIQNNVTINLSVR